MSDQSNRPAPVEVILSIRRLHGAWPLSDTQAQRLVLDFFPDPVRTFLHDAQPKAHTFVFGVRPDVEDAGWLRITLLTPELAEFMLPGPPRRVELRMGAYSLDLARPPDVTTYSELLAGLDTQPARSLHLRSISPTRLGVGGTYKLPLPVPWLLLAEPVRCWDSFSRLEGAPDDLAQWMQANVGIARLALNDQAFPVEGGQEPGFVGDFTLLVQPRAVQSVRWRWVHLLADYAHFTGVGDRRARGAGQLRIVPPSP